MFLIIINFRHPASLKDRMLDAGVVEAFLQFLSSTEPDKIDSTIIGLEFLADGHEVIAKRIYKDVSRYSFTSYYCRLAQWKWSKSTCSTPK